MKSIASLAEHSLHVIAGVRTHIPGMTQSGSEYDCDIRCARPLGRAARRSDAAMIGFVQRNFRRVGACWHGKAKQLRVADAMATIPTGELLGSHGRRPRLIFKAGPRRSELGKPMNLPLAISREGATGEARDWSRLRRKKRHAPSQLESKNSNIASLTTFGCCQCAKWLALSISISCAPGISSARLRV